MEYSRIGKNTNFESVDIADIVEDVQNDLALLIEENKATVKCDEMPVVYGVKTGLGQLFQNLIINAIKYQNDTADPIVEILCEEREEDFLFGVSDNGIGIEPKHKEKIFVIFQRLHDRNAYEGVGIGLANCKKIVHLHQGEIWVESDGHSGSKFCFTIPKSNN